MPTGQLIGGFSLGDTIGEGGMGIVHRAVQTSLGREVALKLVRPEASGDSTDASRRAATNRFIAEAKITALVEHANVVPIYTLDETEDGRPQLAMKLVAGRTLGDLIAERCDEEDRVALLRILLKVCDAVEHAHARGFIHRDLKPDNVMVGEHGQVFVLDWGIAVGLDREACEAQGLLHVEQVEGPAGTPSYMAPELARGDGFQQGPWTDVYLLGGILHAILTGSSRHGATTVNDALRHALSSAPATYPPGVPPELANIANRATAGDRLARYPSVAAFREAIVGHLDHRAAHQVARTGQAALERMEMAEGTAVERAYREAVFAFGQALAMWDGLDAAHAGRLRAADRMLRTALIAEDLGLAERVREERAEFAPPDPELDAEVASLKQRLEARATEAAALRQTAQRMDWPRISPVLGHVFILGGLAGPLLLAVTRLLIEGRVEQAFYVNAATWIAVASLVGGYAYFALRRVQMPRSIAATRVLGTWAAVALACLAVGLFNELRPVPLNEDMGYACLLMGVGFVAMALQTRRWLLAPAAIFFFAALAIALQPERGYELNATAWVIALGGTGLALRRGATLSAEENPLE